MRFDEKQLGVISNSLRVAAERFDEIAREACMADNPLRAQFTLQALQAREMHDAIAQATGISS